MQTLSALIDSNQRLSKAVFRARHDPLPESLKFDLPIYAADPKHIPDKIGLSDEEKKKLIDKSQLLLP